MSRTDKDSKAGKSWLESVGYPFARDSADSTWNRMQRKQERRKAKQSLENRREPSPIYRRPYYW